MIELLTTLAAATLLASTALINFKDFQSKTYSAAARSDLKNVVTAFESYYIDNNNFLNYCNGAKACVKKLPGTSFSENTGIWTRSIFNGATDKRYHIVICNSKHRVSEATHQSYMRGVFSKQLASKEVTHQVKAFIYDSTFKKIKETTTDNVFCEFLAER